MWAITRPSLHPYVHSTEIAFNFILLSSEIEAWPTPEQENAHSETVMNMSSKSIECEAHETITTATKSEPMEEQYVLKLLSVGHVL